MNDITAEYLELIEIAKAAARHHGPVEPTYDIDELAQEIIVKYLLQSCKEEILNVRALIRSIAWDVYTGAIGREKRRI